MKPIQTEKLRAEAKAQGLGTVATRAVASNEPSVACMSVPEIGPNNLRVLQYVVGTTLDVVGTTIGQRLTVVKNMNPICEIGHHLHVMLDPYQHDPELIFNVG